MKNKTTDELAKILWDFNALYQPIKKADCILVMGSHDIRVAHYGAELFLQGFAPVIVFSGDVGMLTDGLWDKSEAEIFAEEAIRLGVPPDKILIENKSTNTGQNIILTKQLLADKKIDVRSIIVVQKPYMQRRAYATMKKLWPEVVSTITAPKISYEEYPNKLISKELLFNIIVGDTQRIKAYAEKGFQIPQKIPNEVWKAFRELVKRGYTKHLIK